MILQIESTRFITLVDGVPCRLVAVANSQDAAVFEANLLEQAQPAEMVPLPQLLELRQP